MQFNNWIISTHYEDAFWVNTVSSVIKHERNVTKIAQIPAVGLFHADRLFGSVFWLIFVIATVCGRAFGGHVADIFHLCVFDPTLGTGKLFKKKSCLIYAELGLFAEGKLIMACW